MAARPQLVEVTALPRPVVCALQLCGLEGLPGTGKSTVCRELPSEHVSDYAGSDVGPTRFPELKLDRSGRWPLDLKSVWRNSQFFLQCEIERTRVLAERGVRWAVLDRTWLSAIVFSAAVTSTLKLPQDLLAHSIDVVERALRRGLVYFPTWLLIFKIPERESFRRVVARDGGYFGENMVQTFTPEQRAKFLAARAEAYRQLEQTTGLPLVTMSYRAPLADKCRAAAQPPAGLAEPQPHLFIRSLRQVMLLEGYQ